MVNHDAEGDSAPRRPISAQTDCCHVSAMLFQQPRKAADILATAQFEVQQHCSLFAINWELNWMETCYALI